jgi:hypothetical protein
MAGDCILKFVRSWRPARCSALRRRAFACLDTAEQSPSNADGPKRFAIRPHGPKRL